MTNINGTSFDPSPALTRLPLFAQPLHATQPAPEPTAFDAPVDHARVEPADVDWQLVAALRAQASEQLSQSVAADRGQLDRAAQEELGRSVVLDLVESAMAEAVNGGEATWPPYRQRALAQAVFDSLFRLGRLQPLIDDDRVENVVIAGFDKVLLELVDGSLIDGPPVADSMRS